MISHQIVTEHLCWMAAHQRSMSAVNRGSWHSFHLAKAKLQASSKTSALLSGFVMVCAN